jgi:hypothetical protein
MIAHSWERSRFGGPFLSWSVDLNGSSPIAAFYLDLDDYRGMTAQVATDIRRKLSQFSVNIWRGGHADHERTDEIMLRGLFSLTAAAALIATSTATHAFTITNRDRTKHIFTILVEDDEWNIIIQPNETLSHLCRSGCSIALGSDEDQDFQGTETVKIVDGRLIVGK